MKNIKLLLLSLFVVAFANAQKTDIKIAQKINDGYQFNTIIDIDATDIKSQGNTGTCWSFSTSSFVESEILRKTGKKVDISEMFTVRNIYDDKAWNYIMRQGKIQFSEGGLAHDVINSIRNNGLVTEQDFQGKKKNGIYNHSKIIKEIKPILDDFIKNGVNSKHPNWKKDVKEILDREIGEIPNSIKFNKKEYTPLEFVKELKFNADDYVTLTSFTHIPFYSEFVLNIPDNFSNGSMYNIPLYQLIKVINTALEKGYTIALDVDVSEKTFFRNNGIAVLPKDINEAEKAKTRIVDEIEVNQDLRQKEFENYNTTDDHLMHIVGKVKDKKGNIYYKVKNSWGKKSGKDGYMYMSVPYLKLKTISILLNKGALPKDLLEKIKAK
jgi:bleomycin hydrolase